MKPEYARRRRQMAEFMQRANAESVARAAVAGGDLPGAQGARDQMTIDEVYTRLLAVLRGEKLPFCFIGALGAIAWGRPRATTDLVDVDSIVETRLAANTPIDWELVRRWALDWGIEDRVDALRARFPKA